jgi:hypothetical protein
MRTEVLLVLALAACTAPSPAKLTDELAYIRGEAIYGWRAAGNPEPGDCLRSTDVRWAQTYEEFAKNCLESMSGMHYPHDFEWFKVQNPAGCMAFEPAGGIRNEVRPYVLLKPWQATVDGTGGIVLHELLHVLHRCTHGGDFDGDHNNPRVWAKKTSFPVNAQKVARDRICATMRCP